MSQNQDNTTARPWRARQWDNCISIDSEGKPWKAGVAFINPLKVSPVGEAGAIPSKTDKANADLIVTAVNEREALLAIAAILQTERDRTHYAEYCKAMAHFGSDSDANHTKAKEHADKYVSYIDNALAALAALRKGQQ